MSTSVAPVSKLLHLSRAGDTEDSPLKKVLLSTSKLQVVQLHLAAGKEIPPHSAPGEITVQSLQGRVAFHVGGQAHELVPGTLLYVAAGQVHSLQAAEESRLLVTKVIPSPTID